MTDAGSPVDRRTVLRWGGVAALALAGCSATKHRATPVPPTTAATTATRSTTTTTLGTTPASALAWSALGASLAGRLVRPSDSGYADAIKLFDPRFDVIRPAGIAYCANASDVQRCLAFAREHGLPFAPRSGGHSYAGYSTSTGLVIDVTPMNAVNIGRGSATTGAGARLIDVYTSLNGAGVSIPAGSCPTVGIAGLAMGGGIGVVARLHGLTCDSMTAVQIVTADGSLVRADANTNDDLFWACRGGGGGNFGVAVSFDFATFPTSSVSLFTLRWPWAAAADALSGWMRWIADAPDALSVNCILSAQPGGSALLGVNGVFVGSESDLAPLLDRLATEVGSAPSHRFVESTTFSHAMYVEAGCAQLSQGACHVIGETPQATQPRGPSFARSDILMNALDDRGVQTLLAGLDARQASGNQGAVAFDAYGGAINRVPAGATAFVHRNALCGAQYSVDFAASNPPALVAAHEKWLDDYYATMRPYVSGQAYQNYIDPALANWPSAYYGTNLARLQTVKRKWDPDNAFRFAQSIPVSP